jgi:small subunit ribosomal protein S16
VGSKKNPIWRVVVADQRSPRDGRFIETIGHYNPQTEPSTIRLDEERLQHWLARGAQPTGSVKQLVKAYAKSGGAAGAEAASVAAEAPGTAEAAPAEAAAPADAPGEASAPDDAPVPDDAGEGAPESAAPGEPAPGIAETDPEPTDAPGPEAPDPAADAEDAADAVDGEAPSTDEAN